jgi:sirohydrochlorin ferrochelatase
MDTPLLIVAHGQPGEPGPAAADIEALSRAVALGLPGRPVAGATLAEPDGLTRALSALAGHARTSPLVYPFFMSDGWFVSTSLPRRLAEAGAAGARILTPFGLDPGLPGLALRRCRETILRGRWGEADTVLVLAAHGSGASTAPRRAAEAFRNALRTRAAFRDLRLGFIEEPPFLADVLRDAGSRALLLPHFVARWSHVLTDIPAAAASADFTGLTLDPIGTDPEVPGMIARAVQAASP